MLAAIEAGETKKYDILGLIDRPFNPIACVTQRFIINDILPPAPRTCYENFLFPHSSF